MAVGDMGFERAENEAGKKLSWRWQTRTEHGALMVLELLADAPDIAGGRLQALPTDGTISALNIPHSSIVFDLHQVTEIQAELLGDNGIATEKIKHANPVSFTCLKAFAFDQRFERKDAYDLIYCLEHGPEGLAAVAEAFGLALAGKHSAVTAGKYLMSSCGASPMTRRPRATARTVRFRWLNSKLAKGRRPNCVRPGCSGSARTVISLTVCAPTLGSRHVNRVPEHAQCPDRDSIRTACVPAWSSQCISGNCLPVGS